MKVFSASEAIWPGLERTHAYLFRPFKTDAFLKLAAVATLGVGKLLTPPTPQSVARECLAEIPRSSPDRAAAAGLDSPFNLDRRLSSV